nr:EthD domain-containing protein [uncultured Roseateles sp.]
MSITTSEAQCASAWKMIYLARRNPRLAAADFAQAWREHSALGRQCRNVGQRVKRVTQCSRVLDLPAQPGISQHYDGVNLLLLADREAATAIWSDPETLAIMKPDEPRVFDRYVREFSLVCAEHVLRDGPHSAVALHGFLRRRPALSSNAFRLAWRAASPGRQLLRGALGQAERLVVNEVVDAPPAGYEYDMVVEWWFDSTEEAQQALAGQDVRAHLAPALAALLDADASVFMLTRVTHARP